VRGFQTSNDPHPSPPTGQREGILGKLNDSANIPPLSLTLLQKAARIALIRDNPRLAPGRVTLRVTVMYEVQYE
jgi:hypothetical protein